MGGDGCWVRWEWCEGEVGMVDVLGEVGMVDVGV